MISLQRLKSRGEAAGERFFRHRGYWLLIPVTILMVSRLMSSAPWRMEGLALLAIALALRLWAGAHVGAHSNGSRLEGPTLAVTGPYAHTRHPLYIANILSTLALAVSANSLAWPGMAALVLAVTSLFATLILAEEKTLSTLHGETFRQYRERVPALGWRFQSQDDTKTTLGGDWPASLKRQGRNALYALALWFFFWLAALWRPVLPPTLFSPAPAPIPAEAPAP